MLKSWFFKVMPDILPADGFTASETHIYHEAIVVFSFTTQYLPTEWLWKLVQAGGNEEQRNTSDSIDFGSYISKGHLDQLISPPFNLFGASKAVDEGGEKP